MRNALHEIQAYRRSHDPDAYAIGAANGVIIDRQGFDEVLFEVNSGTLGAAATLDFKVQHGNDSGLSDAADVTGAAITQMVKATDDDKIVLLRIRGEGLKRYIRGVLTIGVATSDAGVSCKLAGKHGELPELNAAHADVLEVKSVDV